MQTGQASYLGPLLYGLRPAYSEGTGYAGPGYFNLNEANADTTISGDLTGPLFVRMLTPGHFVYDFDADFNQFGGTRSVRNDTMTLGYTNVPAELGVTDLIYHYRPGSKGNLQNTPPNVTINGTALSKGGGTLAFDDDGVRPLPPTDSVHGYFAGGGPFSNHVLLDAAAGKDSGVLSAWVLLDRGDVTSTIWGHDESDRNGFMGSPYATQVVVKWLANSGLYVSAWDINSSSGQGGGMWTCTVPHSYLPIVAGTPFHLMIQFTWANEYDDNMGSNVDRGIIRIWVDGKWIVDSRYPLMFGPFSYTGSPKLGNVTKTPFFLAERYYYNDYVYNPETDNYELTEVNDVANPLRGSADEIFAARWTPPIGTAKPKYLSDSYNVTVNPDWTAGDEDTFTPPRRPDPTVLGVDHAAFIAYGPVEDSTMGGEAGIDRALCRFSLPGDPAGQGIAVSIRANPTTFDADDHTIPWGSWFPLGELNNQWATLAGGGFGNYVQIRVKFTPSTVDSTDAPVVDRLEFWAEPTANLEGFSDVPATIDLRAEQGRSSIPARINVRQVRESYVPATIKFQKQAPNNNVPAAITIIEQGFSFMPSRIFVRQMANKYIPALIALPETGQVEHYIPAILNVDRATVVTPIPAQILVRQERSVAIPAKITFVAHMIPCKITVQTPLPTHFIPATIFVRPDLPTAVGNLRANVSANTWQPVADITFDWDAAQPATTAVTGYRYLLDNNAATEVDPAWASTASLTKAYDLSLPEYLTGKWYFHVAAYNAAGHYGPTSHYGVWYNRPTTQPGTIFMKLNGQDTLLQVPLLSVASTTYAEFTWNASTDPDAGDVVRYEIQVAIRDHFGVDSDSGSESIVRQAQNLTTNSWNLTPSLKSGVYFWRIRSSDSKQYSEWSPVGSFRVNSPPGRPIGLAVEDW